MWMNSYPPQVLYGAYFMLTSVSCTQCLMIYSNTARRWWNVRELLKIGESDAEFYMPDNSPNASKSCRATHMYIFSEKNLDKEFSKSVVNIFGLVLHMMNIFGSRVVYVPIWMYWHRDGHFNINLLAWWLLITWYWYGYRIVTSPKLDFRCWCILKYPNGIATAVTFCDKGNI